MRVMRIWFLVFYRSSMYQPFRPWDSTSDRRLAACLGGAENVVASNNRAERCVYLPVGWAKIRPANQ